MDLDDKININYFIEGNFTTSMQNMEWIKDRGTQAISQKEKRRIWMTAFTHLCQTHI